jgi:threonyl-tRNA synthetase
MEALEHSGELSLDDELYRIRHSLAHVLAQAVLEVRPGSTLGFGPPIKDGFYYDFILSAPITEEDFPEIEQRMRKILKKGQRFDREELPKDAALARLAEMKEPYKREYALELFDKKQLASLSFYRNGPFLDMCEGPHVHTTKEIPRDAFKLKSVAGAYWRGNSDNVMMTRIYAWAFANKEQLDDYVAKYELALARDHKKLGRELGIYHIDNDIGKGLPLWLPAGTVVRDEIEKLAKELEFRAGYQRVVTPHLAKVGLYYRTGHMPYYAEHMYPVMEVKEDSEEGEVRESYVLRPMNCPHHHKVYASSPRSYRDLPLRLFELGTVYRFEKSGVLHGLLRVRGFTQDDAHIFCKK